MILTKIAKVKIGIRNKTHYINKGYDANIGDIIPVKIEDLSKGSSAIVEVTCDNCNKVYSKKYNQILEGKSFCSKKCLYENTSKQFLKEFESKIGEDAKSFLEREYIQNKKSFRKISIEIFGDDRYRNSLARWCDKLNIKKRHGSEAVETQWINNPERRKQNSELMRRVMNIEGSKKDYTIAELRKTSQYQECRLKVYARDNFTCVKCGKPRAYNRKLNAHHLYSFMYNEDLRYDAENGVTLCQSCHMKFHSKYSNRNNTREQFEEFLKAK